MHQSTQRRICRLVFLAGCVLPTLAVTAWTCAEHLPGTTAKRLARIERALGMRVVAADLCSPTPGVWRVSDLTISDVETGEPVLTAKRVEWQPRDQRLVIQMQGVQLATDGLPRIARVAQQALAVDWPQAVIIDADGLAWQGDTGPAAEALLHQRRLRATLDTRGEQGQVAGRRLVVQLQSAADRSDSGPRIEVHRNWQLTPPASRVVVDTAGQAVPADWLAELDPLLPAGGRQATFTGLVTLTTDGHHSDGHLQGSLAQVELARLVQLPIDTVATVADLELRWQAGHLTLAQGVVRSGPGSMEAPLARTLAGLYELAQPGAQVVDGALEFGTLGTAFVLNEHALSLWGACPAEDPEHAACLLDRHGQPLFAQPDRRASLSLVTSVLSSYGGQDASLAVARLPRDQRWK